jgi:hypothetical protein
VEIERLRKTFLWLFVGFLGLTALVAIVTVLIGEFDELDGKILGTTFTLSAASICAMSCAAFIEKRKVVSLGIAGIGAAALAAAMVIIGMWAEIGEEIYLKSLGTMIVLAVGFAHTFLLVLPDLVKQHRWAQPVAMLLIFILGLQILFAIWIEPDADLYFKILTVFAILVGLMTLMIPILLKIGKGGGSVGEGLLLKHKEADLYTDNEGVVYEVKRVESSQSSMSSS